LPETKPTNGGAREREVLCRHQNERELEREAREKVKHENMGLGGGGGGEYGDWSRKRKGPMKPLEG